MNSFSISDLAQFSGIKAPTIRMWEQRYNALTPHRSEGNTRYYDNTQLRRLLNIVSLMNLTYKVSELCAMPDDKLFKLLNQQLDGVSNESSEYFISQLLAAGTNYDEVHFEKIFAHCLLRHGVRDAYVEIIYPMLVRIGMLWASNSMPVAQEHFISNLVRQKLSTAIDALPPAKPLSENWILFLPENEFHDIGLLVAHYLIKLSGRKVFYLGGNVPLPAIRSAFEDIKADNLLLFLVRRRSSADIEEYLTQLSSWFGGKKIYVTLRSEAVSAAKTHKKVEILHSIQSLENKLS